MKRILITGLGLILVAGVIGAGTGVTNSVHDFSFGNTGGDVAATAATEDQICKFCHAPHNNASGLTNAPLWNHETTATALFGTYDSATFNGTGDIADIGAGDNTSWLCMSCHDGTVAVGQLQNELVALEDGGAGVLLAGVLDDTRNMGVDMRNDHPINFDAVTAAAADGEITMAATYPLDANDIMHCSTCHDPHDGPTTASNGNLLRGNPTGSQICLDCHTLK
jgi:predicted CXXCH cytochrome family protein